MPLYVFPIIKRASFAAQRHVVNTWTTDGVSRAGGFSASRRSPCANQGREVFRTTRCCSLSNSCFVRQNISQFNAGLAPPPPRRLVFLGGDPSNPIELRCHEEPHMLGMDRNFAGYLPNRLGHVIEDPDGGKYTLVRKLGWASYSSVWLALYRRHVSTSAMPCVEAHTTSTGSPRSVMSRSRF